MTHCNSYVFEVLVALEQFEFALLVAVKIFFQFYSNFPKIFAQQRQLSFKFSKFQIKHIPFVLFGRFEHAGLNNKRIQKWNLSERN